MTRKRGRGGQNETDCSGGCRVQSKGGGQAPISLRVARAIRRWKSWLGRRRPRRGRVLNGAGLAAEKRQVAMVCRRVHTHTHASGAYHTFNLAHELRMSRRRGNIIVEISADIPPYPRTPTEFSRAASDTAMIEFGPHDNDGPSPASRLWSAIALQLQTIRPFCVAK